MKNSMNAACPLALQAVSLISLRECTLVSAKMRWALGWLGGRTSLERGVQKRFYEASRFSFG
jgi:hypothetical protein